MPIPAFRQGKVHVRTRSLDGDVTINEMIFELAEVDPRKSRSHNPTKWRHRRSVSASSASSGSQLEVCRFHRPRSVSREPTPICNQARGNYKNKANVSTAKPLAAVLGSTASENSSASSDTTMEKSPDFSRLRQYYRYAKDGHDIEEVHADTEMQKGETRRVRGGSDGSGSDSKVWLQRYAKEGHDFDAQESERQSTNSGLKPQTHVWEGKTGDELNNTKEGADDGSPKTAALRTPAARLFVAACLVKAHKSIKTHVPKAKESSSGTPNNTSPAGNKTNKHRHPAPPGVRHETTDNTPTSTKAKALGSAKKAAVPPPPPPRSEHSTPKSSVSKGKSQTPKTAEQRGNGRCKAGAGASTTPTSTKVSRKKTREEMRWEYDLRWLEEQEEIDRKAAEAAAKAAQTTVTAKSRPRRSSELENSTTTTASPSAGKRNSKKVSRKVAVQHAPPRRRILFTRTNSYDELVAPSKSRSGTARTPPSSKAVC